MLRGHLHQNDCYDAEEIARATNVGMDRIGLAYPFLFDGRKVHKMEWDEALPPVRLPRGMKVMLLITPYTYTIHSESKKGIAMRVPSIAVIEDTVHETKLNREPLTPLGRRNLKRMGGKDESLAPAKRGRKNEDEKHASS